MIVKFLGVHNAESKDNRHTSFVIDDILAVDAGSLTIGLSFAEQEKIKAILLSHGHYDHIKGVPAFAFNNPQHTTKVFATQPTLEILSTHLVDGLIYPNFTEVNSFIIKPALDLIPIKPLEPVSIEDFRVMAISVFHPIDSVGFDIISSDGKEIFYTGDTGPGLVPIWQYISPNLIIADTTFPDRYADLARESGHLCPQMLKDELIGFRHVKDYLPRVVLSHLSPQLENEIREEVDKVSKELGHTINIASEGEKLVI